MHLPNGPLSDLELAELRQAHLPRAGREDNLLESEANSLSSPTLFHLRWRQLATLLKTRFRFRLERKHDLLEAIMASSFPHNFAAATRRPCTIIPKRKGAKKQGHVTQEPQESQVKRKALTMAINGDPYANGMQLFKQPPEHHSDSSNLQPVGDYPSIAALARRVTCGWSGWILWGKMVEDQLCMPEANSRVSETLSCDLMPSSAGVRVGAAKWPDYVTSIARLRGDSSSDCRCPFFVVLLPVAGQFPRWPALLAISSQPASPSTHPVSLAASFPAPQACAKLVVTWVHLDLTPGQREPIIVKQGGRFRRLCPSPIVQPQQAFNALYATSRFTSWPLAGYGSRKKSERSA
ncbi:hypothetical protein AOQ84DRAFT_226805 [Glonium stellatum]|uniref:Uncharacterized protein n=1 Tax=Glonium stellatum TaxID=574774 RepID=A0A8E2ESH1_9PEZI|nr:hypothetical protein AOQ84DRAFT_226805 [Glonium stellatum]